jgi:hypothetical protein
VLGKAVEWGSWWRGISWRTTLWIDGRAVGEYLPWPETKRYTVVRAVAGLFGQCLAEVDQRGLGGAEVDDQRAWYLEIARLTMRGLRRSRRAGSRLFSTRRPIAPVR